jgi:CBS domain-containing protein
VAIDSRASTIDTVKLMGRHGIRHLLVEEEGEIVGIISLRGIVRATMTAVML